MLLFQTRAALLDASAWSDVGCETLLMFVVRGTQKLLDRARASFSEEEPPTNALGDWYATALSWRPQLALLVNEPTLLPVLVPLAPTKSLIDRFVAELGTVFALVGLDPRFIETELGE